MTSIVDFGIGGLLITDLTWDFCRTQSGVISTAGSTLSPLGDNSGRYLLDNPNAVDGTMFEVYVLTDRTNYQIGEFTAPLAQGSLIDGTITIEQALKAILAMSTGLTVGAGTNVIRFRNQTNTTSVITAAFDVQGDRTTVVLDFT